MVDFLFALTELFTRSVAAW